MAAWSTEPIGGEAASGSCRRHMIMLIRTTDLLKVTAVNALLRSAGISCLTFDGAAGALWSAIIPVRIMVAEADHFRARSLLRDAGFIEASDGEWDIE